MRALVAWQRGSTWSKIHLTQSAEGMTLCGQRIPSNARSGEHLSLAVCQRCYRTPDYHQLAEDVVQTLEAMGLDSEVFINEAGEPLAVATEELTQLARDLTERKIRRMASDLNLPIQWAPGTDQLLITLQVAE